MVEDQAVFTLVDPETGEEFTFKPAALVSNVRDVLLDMRRQQVEAKPWGKLTETDQKEEIGRMTNLAFGLVQTVVDVVSMAGMQCAYVEVSKFAVDVDKGLVSITSVGQASDDVLVQLAHAKGMPCRLAVLDGHRFNSDGKPVKVTPDQPDMLDDGEPEDPAPLADEDDEIIDAETGEILDRETTEVTPSEAEDEPLLAQAMADAIEADEVDDATGIADSATDPAETAPETADDAPMTTTEVMPEGDVGTGHTPLADGYAAHMAGVEPIENPYEDGTEDHADWRDGYTQAGLAIDEVTAEGAQARVDGMAPHRCPHAEGSHHHRHWMAGYNEAKDAETD